MPAEWAPHAATWLSFPHKEASWPGKLLAAQRAYARMVAELATSEPVYINVNDAAMETHARRLLDAAKAGGEITFHRFPTNDAWCRDHGAIFVRRDMPACPSGVGWVESSSPTTSEASSQLVGLADSTHPTATRMAASVQAADTGKLPVSTMATDWRYNAWGEKYPPHDLDNEIPRLMAETLGVPRAEIDMVLEGGSIEVNGEGLLLTTEACLLNPNRNPQLNREDIELRLREMLGVEKILWLMDGIIGDDTDGHIDDLTRFVAANTLVTVIEENPLDENYGPLQQNLVLLQNMKNLAGKPFEIVQLPMPSPVTYQGQRLPASHANFYIGNRVVLLPVYNCPADQQAIDTLARLFPTRRIAPIESTDLIWGLGSCHCLTQQVPY
jgi:agmatine deiminase